ncbi:hypothetical protein ACIBL3_40405 [Kribbella sp. NPDC050124]|uniref:hypothetical protein n=1 Tax=Kribbella sp. NPDC050124 TaxID=3364114 RepID=UPI0037A29611
MSTPNPTPPEKENWWTRIGTMGQALTAVVGLIAALVPILVKTGLPGRTDDDTTPPQTRIVTTAPQQTPRQTLQPVAPTQRRQISLTVSDQLTEGAEEEIIVISLEGKQVARLHATREQPIVTKRIKATKAGNYSYVVDASIRWYDATGTEHVTNATGRGSVAIHDGMRLDVYLHEEPTGFSLSLQSAAE